MSKGVQQQQQQQQHKHKHKHKHQQYQATKSCRTSYAGPDDRGGEIAFAPPWLPTTANTPGAPVKKLFRRSRRRRRRRRRPYFMMFDVITGASPKYLFGRGSCSHMLAVVLP